MVWLCQNRNVILFPLRFTDLCRGSQRLKMSLQILQPFFLYMVWAKCEPWGGLLWNSEIPPQLVSLIHVGLNVSTSRAEEPGKPPPPESTGRWGLKVVRSTASSQNSPLDSDTVGAQDIIDWGVRGKCLYKGTAKTDNIFWYILSMDLPVNKGLGFILLCIKHAEYWPVSYWFGVFVHAFMGKFSALIIWRVMLNLHQTQRRNR